MMLIRLNNYNERFDDCNFWLGFIQLPFAAGSHPIYFPDLLSFYIFTTSKWIFVLLGLIIPLWSNLEKKYFIIFKGISQINLFP